jgi:mono/diheme cytochrome c family protein
MRRSGLVLCAVLAGCGGNADEPWASVQSAKPDPELLVVGARVFDERCAVCHGDAGFGDGTLAEVLEIRPRNYHAEPFRWGTRPSQIVATVANGRSGIMPPFREVLSEREMWAVAALVWRWIPEERREPDDPEALRDWRLPDPPQSGI